MAETWRIDTSAPVHLRVLPVDELTGPRDRFRCERLAAVITAETCSLRQRRTWVGTRTQTRPAEIRPEHISCADCAQGRDVASRVTLAARPRCSAPGCDELAETGRQCPRHTASSYVGRL